MRSRLRRPGPRVAFVALAVAVTAGGCELQRDPTGLELERAALGVHSLLLAGDDRARVLVVRFSRDLPVQNGGIVPVGDADVRLVRDGEETILSAGDTEACVGEPSSHLVQPGDGCYTALLTRAVAPGDRFELTVRLADDAVVRGAAVIPGAPVVSSPSAGDTVRVTRSDVVGSRERFGSLPLDFRPSSDGALVEVAMENSREPFCHVALSRPLVEGYPSSGGTVRIAAADAGESTLTVSALCNNQEGDPDVVGELPSRLLVLAYDTAYARWIQELAVDGEDRSVDEVSAGLTGAVGFFAGAGRVAVPLLIVEE